MPEKTAESPPLTFQWTHSRMRQHGLLFWMFIVLLGLAAFFYVFQVVYPQPQRFTPAPQQVVILNPANPDARALMRKVADRDFLMVPDGLSSTNAVMLEEHAPVFHPSFEGHRLELQDLPHKTFTVPPARLLQMDAPVLPPLDLSELKPAPVPAVSASVLTPLLAVKIAGDLGARVLTHGPDLAGIALAEPTACRFQLGVNAEGQVEFALPMAAAETPEVLARLTKQLQQMRFAPSETKAATASPTWGTASFEWRRGPAP